MNIDEAIARARKSKLTLTGSGCYDYEFQPMREAACVLADEVERLNEVLLWSRQAEHSLRCTARDAENAQLTVRLAARSGAGHVPRRLVCN